MKTKGILTLFAFMFVVPLAKGQSISETTYYPKLRPYNNEIGKVKADIALQLTFETRKLKDILVLDDRIEFKLKDQKTIIYFSDILDDTIKVKKYAVMNVTNILGERITDPNIINSVRRFLDSHVEIGNFVFVFKHSYDCEVLADNLFFIQYKLKEKRNDLRIANFKPIAEQYRALEVKPTISEEQRKFIVQANGFNERKMYEKAIEFYKKVIEVDQTAYPAAYSNLALLSAQINKYDVAIYYMKKYLMLVPDAEDARSCQDKIYEWEIMMQN